MSNTVRLVKNNGPTDRSTFGFPRAFLRTKVNYLTVKVILDNFKATTSSFHPRNHYKTLCESRTRKTISIIEIRKNFLGLTEGNSQF
jgi:hypothetical protein